MSELSQVLSTITNFVEQAVYPNGTGQPSVAGVQVTIESGWPIRSQLDTDLKAGYAHVSVYPTNQERVVTKFGREFESNTFSAPTIITTVSYISGIPVVTLSGTITLPEAVLVIADNITYSYRVLNTDTLNSICVALGNLIPGASVIGTAITLNSNFKAIARVSSNWTASQELSRQERIFRITCWAPNDPIRSALAGAIDITMKQNYRMPMPDNYYAQVFYSHQDDIDNLEKSIVYQRVLYYIVQYATTVVNNYMSLESVVENIEAIPNIV